MLPELKEVCTWPNRPPYEKEAHEKYCADNRLDPSQVKYVMQGSCLVSDGHLITTNISICSGLSIKIGDKKVLSHIDCGTSVATIVDAVRKHFTFPLTEKVKIILYLGNLPLIQDITLIALHQIGILNHFMVLKEVQNDIIKYLVGRIRYWGSFPVREEKNLLELYLTSGEDSEYKRMLRFLKLEEIKTEADLFLCCCILNEMENVSDFVLRRNGTIRSVLPETIITTEDLSN